MASLLWEHMLIMFIRICLLKEKMYKVKGLVVKIFEIDHRWQHGKKRVGETSFAIIFFWGSINPYKNVDEAHKGFIEDLVLYICKATCMCNAKMGGQIQCEHWTMFGFRSAWGGCPVFGAHYYCMACMDVHFSFLCVCCMVRRIWRLAFMRKDGAGLMRMASYGGGLEKLDGKRRWRIWRSFWKKLKSSVRKDQEIYC